MVPIDRESHQEPGTSLLLACCTTAYRREGLAGYTSSSLPPLEFEYTDASVDETVRDVDRKSLENLPYGLDDSHMAGHIILAPLDGDDGNAFSGSFPSRGRWRLWGSLTADAVMTWMLGMALYLKDECGLKWPSDAPERIR